MNTSNRWLWEIAPHAYVFGLLGWKVTRRIDGVTRKLMVFNNKDDAIKYATSECKFWKKLGQYSELKLKNKWGRIEDSRTYGDDPESIHG